MQDDSDHHRRVITGATRPLRAAHSDGGAGVGGRRAELGGLSRSTREGDSEAKAQPTIVGRLRDPLADGRRLPCTARVDRVLPGSVVGDAGHSVPAEFHVVDCDEARTTVFEPTSVPDAVDLVPIALGEVDVRAVRLHPRPPPLFQGIPYLFVGLDGNFPFSDRSNMRSAWSYQGNASST